MSFTQLLSTEKYGQPFFDRAQGTLGAQNGERTRLACYRQSGSDSPPAWPASHPRLSHSRSGDQTGNRAGRLAPRNRWLGREPENVYLGGIQRPPAIRGRFRFPLRYDVEQIRLSLARGRFLHTRRNSETETGSASCSL